MKKIIAVLLCILILAAGCAATTTEEKMTLKVGVMPAVDTSPIYLAKDMGYFDELNLDVEIVLFTNAQDRQSALQTGVIDGAMTDLVALATNRSGGFDLKATTLTDGMFVMLAQEGATDKAELKVGLMEISVSNFLVDHWLAETYKLEKVYINAIPARLEAVASGQLDMGFFPEPLGSVGEMKGLKKLVFEPVGGITPDIMAFTQTAIDAKSDALKAFHQAYDKAVEAINNDESLARETLVKNIPNISEEVKDIMTLPTYHKTRLPSVDYLQGIIDWTNGVVESELNVIPSDMIDTQFID
ncbi:MULTISPECIES: ABC transporter substrate-binding protein [unclassified Fusibacter]|uniref:ABC transporter substrate-binding protein n=1 Tax=unclassified Fusibacter TaxID=2624464 RepID=UPI0013E9144A|nr:MULTISPECIES: ABC transporter substrate-binding protein [unclassified Fusibacter]MCK8058973.1 ABC transporter substrate-binding protein [Fusibacter sp. A2]NPE22384.1 ABC transporter substrate-binding protein [Fusibacter sp. A1]